MDSFILGKIVALLISPLSLSLLLALAGAMLGLLRWRRTGLGLAMVGVAWLWLCSTGGFAALLMDHLESAYPPKAMSVVPEVDAIVLLGGATRGDTHRGIRPDLNQRADRLVHAVALYKRARAPFVLLSGGSPAGGRSEAEQMRHLLLVMGIPSHAMVLEQASRNTHENALYSAPLLKDRGVQRILLVTSAFHMRRAVPLFERQGLEVLPAPTDYQLVVSESVVPGWVPSVRNLARTSVALHELLGFAVYRWRGWL